MFWLTWLYRQRLRVQTKLLETSVVLQSRQESISKSQTADCKSGLGNTLYVSTHTSDVPSAKSLELGLAVMVTSNHRASC